MYIKDIWLKNYRSYEGLHLELEPGITIFLGDNGVGKTNIIEAVFYSGNLHSHRVSNDSSLIRREKQQAEIKIRPVRGKLQLTLHITLDTKARNVANINRGASILPKKTQGIVKTVLFSPEDLNLIRGDRRGRRNFLDELLVLSYPLYLKLKADGERILKQRNALLKSLGSCRSFPPAGEKESLTDTLRVWDTYFIKNSARISWYRSQIVENLNGLAEKRYGKLSGGEKKAKIIYEPSVSEYMGRSETAPSAEDFEKSYVEAVRSVRSLEIERGVSLLGPQRDDMKIILGRDVAKEYASHGESWSLALALKLASYDFLKKNDPDGDDPVVILDDVFAELDASRREKLAAMVEGVEQLLITAAVPEDIPGALTVKGAVAVVDVIPGKAAVRKRKFEAA